MPLRLIIEDDEGATTIVPLAAEAITIGRQQGNTIQLTEKNVSRNHARLYPEDELWVIEDLNSYNGIKVNDKSVEARTKLREGDIVQIGDYHLAITEDVDKRTLNYDRPGQAANDGEGDPLLASSSADLPRLSPDEIHALSSGPQPVTPAPSMVDSGRVPATPYAPGYAEPRKKSGGLLVALGVVVLGAAAAGAFLITNGDKKDATTTTAAANKKSGDDGKARPAVDPTPEPEPPADPAAEVPAADGEVPAADAGDDATEAVVPEDPPPEPVPKPTPTETVDPTPPPEDPVVINDTPDPPPEPAVVKKKKKKTKQNKPPPTPKPPPPPVDSGPSAAELLKQAQRAQLGKNYREAYNLARESNNKSPSQGALKVMGVAGCNLGDKSKAKNAHRKLRGSAKADVEKLCGFKGIEL